MLHQRQSWMHTFLVVHLDGHLSLSDPAVFHTHFERAKTAAIDAEIRESRDVIAALSSPVAAQAVARRRLRNLERQRRIWTPCLPRLFR